MLDVFITIIVVIYSFAVLFVLVHSLFDAQLIYYYLRSHGKDNNVVFNEEEAPFVTIQLPVYNEQYVVERIIDAVAEIDYPRHKFEIQVLDDSTDITVEIINNKVSQLRQLGVPILHIQRSVRTGYKAGALKHGLSLAKGTFIAVFDADFLPAKEFLKRTIPYFKDAKIGMVQTKWGHINKSSSLLATIQAIALDGHFTIEQQGRNAAGYFINFNGTAGVWRKVAILDAGNWQADTLTEDLDLSYRAQMKGWQFKYLENFTTPAELPPLVSALKSQQYRWTKGGAETARKNIKTLFASPFSWSVKLHGFFHLVYSFGFISIVTYVLLTVPLLYIKQYYPQYDFVSSITAVSGFSFIIYILHYFVSYFNNSEGSFIQRLGGFVLHFPLFVSLFIGISLSNSIGIVKGYLGRKSEFVRTPKFNNIEEGFKFITNKYADTKLHTLTYVEGFLMIYFLFGLVQAIVFKSYASVPLLFMAFTGFLMVFGWSLKEWNLKRIMDVAA